MSIPIVSTLIFGWDEGRTRGSKDSPKRYVITHPNINSTRQAIMLTKIFCTAREYRTKRVKEARDEAKKEIDAYKKEKDEELQKYESEHVSGNLKAKEDADLEAEKKIFEIQEAGKEKRDMVVQKILDAVFEITPVVPTRIETPQ
ncbi:hypothetical protein Golomagni_00046 [Golovinomyces magnicellulatus]|nr:hypothetical protein Golomagni_00046 [Golovinomyces magnicellulatus]